MAKRIEVVGVQPKRIQVVSESHRRIEPSELAAALGAELGGVRPSGDLDLISLAELGTALVHPLRSSAESVASADAGNIVSGPSA
jgi:hypothetical protein